MAAADNSPVSIKKGEDPRVLVIAFTGFKGGYIIPAFDFLRVSNLLQYSRIMLADTSRTCYLGGIPPSIPDYASLCKLLHENIAELNPGKIICVGRSGGAYAALLFGHELKADYVHAFSPYTYVDTANIEKYKDPDGLEHRLDALKRIHSLPDNIHHLFDLKTVMMQGNGKSIYYIHVCQQSQWDFHRAMHLKDCEGVKIIGYPCDSHGVAIALAKQGLLPDLLNIDNQERIGEVLAGKMRVKKDDAEKIPD